MDFSAFSKVKNGCIKGEVDVPGANEYTMYAYYLYEKNRGVLEKQWYRKDNAFSFQLSESGIYYVRVFVRRKKGAEDEYVTASQNTNIVRFYATKAIQYQDMDREDFRTAKATIYRIMWDGVPFEFLIHSKEKSEKAVVFGTGALQVSSRDSWPLFDRVSWSAEIPENTIYYFDPTLYSGNLSLGWGYGTNKRWYLENIAVLLDKILEILAVKRENVLFYGSSGGGYMSLILATLLHGKATVINPQIIVENYFSSAIGKLKSAVLSQGESLIRKRCDAVKLFCAEQYFPYIHLVQNICAEEDVITQITLFLQTLVKEKINCEDCLHIDFYGDERGHSGMPDKEKCLRMIEEDLNRPVSGIMLNRQEPGYEPLLQRMEKGEL